MNTRRTPLFLMANLGSEVSKLYLFIEKKETKMAHETLLCATRIIDEIRQFPEMKTRAQELELLSCALRDTVKEKPILKITPTHLKAYFHPFVSRLMSSKR